MTGGPGAAGLGRRGVAFVVDLGGTVLVTLVVVLVLITTAYSGPTSSEALADFAIAMILVIPAVAFLLNLVLAWLKCGTIAQRMLGLLVVDRTTGARIGLGRTIVRSLILLAPAVLQLVLSPLTNQIDGGPWAGFGSAAIGCLLNLVAPLGWLVMLLAALAGKGRGWHDRAANSAVIDARTATQ